MNQIWKYLSIFLAGVAMTAMAILLFLLKKGTTVINADNYVQKLEQSIKKLKQRGEGNSQDIDQSINLIAENEPELTNKEKRIKKREDRRAAKNK